MYSSQIWKIISVILLSSVKFSIGGIPLAIFYQFTFLETIITTSIGGILGVFVFYFISEWLITASKKVLKSRKNKTPKKVFTWKNKLIINTKNKMGLAGLALLTPLLLSIPFGLFLASRYYKNRNKILLYMSVSVVVCSVILSCIKFLF